MPEQPIELTEAEIGQVAGGYIGAGIGIPDAATQGTNPGLAVAATHTTSATPGTGGSPTGGQIIREPYFP